MTRRSVARAPAKAILLGEHFVVSGTRAIAASLSLYAYAEAEELRSWPSEIVSTELGLRVTIPGPDLSYSGPVELEPIVAVLRALRSRDFDIPPFRLTIRSEIPDGAGLGSSASASAASALALAGLVGSDMGRDELFTVTMEGEKVAHGNPSGVDPATVVYGGVILFKRGEGIIERNEGLDGVSLIVADSGLRRRTAGSVSSVLSLLEKIGSIRQHIMSAVEEMVAAAWDSIKTRSFERLGLLMNLNHGLLSAIGVSTPELEELVYAARRAGALGSKLTGAGLGGSVIALAAPGLEGPVQEAMARRARWVAALQAGVQGASIVSEA